MNLDVYCHSDNARSLLDWVESFNDVPWCVSIVESHQRPFKRCLWWENETLFLCSHNKLERPWSIDFEEYFERWDKEKLRPRNEALGKALNIELGKIRHILDATPGTGKDLSLFLYWNQKVWAYERNLSIYLLLLNAKSRALKNNDSRLENLTLKWADSKKTKKVDFFDAVYFDPMYPDKGKKKSSLSRKEMESFKELVGDDEDAAETFLALWKICPLVVVKRSPKAPLLNPDVNSQWTSKNLRLDRFYRSV